MHTKINGETAGNAGMTATERPHRPRMFKGGIISFQNFTITVDCIIRDQTEGGVKLKIGGEHFVPERFHLTIPIDGVRAECQVRWRKGQLIGAAVLDGFSPDDRNARKQSMESAYIAPRKSILRKNSGQI